MALYRLRCETRRQAVLLMMKLVAFAAREVVVGGVG